MQAVCIRLGLMVGYSNVLDSSLVDFRNRLSCSACNLATVLPSEKNGQPAEAVIIVFRSDRLAAASCWVTPSSVIPGMPSGSATFSHETVFFRKPSSPDRCFFGTHLRLCDACLRLAALVGPSHSFGNLQPGFHYVDPPSFGCTAGSSQAPFACISRTVVAR